MLLTIRDLSSVLLFAATFLAVYVVYRSRSNRKFPPSLPWLPVVGSLPFMGQFNRIPRMFMEKAVSIGNVFSFYAGSKYVVVINGREAIHDALVSRSTDFADREMPFLLKHFKLRESFGLVMRPYGADFKKVQQQTLSILKEFGFGKSIMESRISLEVSHLIEFVNARNGDAYDYHDILTTSVMNVIHAIVFGHRCGADDPRLQQLIHGVDSVVRTIVSEIDFLPMLRFVPYFKRRLMNSFVLHRQLKTLIDSCIRETLESELPEDSFVRSFMDGGGDCFEISGIVQDLMIAGSDTTTTTLRWCLLMLANYPQVQDRLQKDIDSVVPRKRLPTLDDKSSLPFVEASLLELMRWKTLVPLAAPHKTLCDTQAGGYFVPKGTKVVVNLYSIHMDTGFWKDPSVFRPERFLDDGGNVTGRNLVTSFSLGKRSCMGEQLARQELFLFFTGLLQHFEIRPPDGQDFVDETENLHAAVFPSPFQVRLIPRNLQ